MLSAAVALTFLENVEYPRAVARTSAILIASFVNMLILVAAWKTNDRAEFQGRGGPNPWRSFRDVVTNPHSRILIGVFFLEQLGFSALVALMPYSSDYVVNTPGSPELYLFGAIGSALVSIPLWIDLSRQVGKKPILIFSIATKSVLFGMAFFLDEGDFIPTMIIAVVFGLVNGCGSVVGPSLKADVIDRDEAETGARKEGAYFAAWNIIQKAAGGVAIWATGVMLAITGFVPNVAQSPNTLFGMMLLAPAAPAALNLLALFVMFKISLAEDAYRAARAKAEARLKIS